MVSFVVKVADGPAVAHHQVFESPFIPQDLLQQAVAATARFSLETLVSTHDFLHVRLLHEGLECGQVGFPKVARVEVFNVETVAQGFRPAMHGEMFRTGMELVVFRVFRALQSFYHGHAHARSQIGVFAPCFLSASPTRVAEDVHVWGPKCQAFISPPVMSLPSCLVEFCPGFVAHGAVNMLHRFGVERGSHPHRDGINRGKPVAGHSVQGFVPPTVGLDVQPFHGRRRIFHQ